MKELEYADFKTLQQMQFCIVTNSSMQDLKIEKNLVIKDDISCEEYMYIKLHWTSFPEGQSARIKYAGKVFHVDLCYVTWAIYWRIVLFL